MVIRLPIITGASRGFVVEERNGQSGDWKGRKFHSVSDSRHEQASRHIWLAGWLAGPVDTNTLFALGLVHGAVAASPGGG